MKKLLCGLLAGIVIGTGTSVFAYNTQTINAIFGKVKLVVDNKPIAQETLLYNGTTYVPLRAAGEALGKVVTYDAENSTAYIGEVSSQSKTANSASNCYAEVTWALDIQKYTSLELLQKYPTDKGYTYVYAYGNTSKKEFENYFNELIYSDYKTITAGDIIMFTKIDNGIGKDITIMALDDKRQIILNAETFIPKSNSSNVSSITLDEFNKIQAGMPYSKVVDIIGGNGELVSESTVGEYTAQTYMWKGSDFDTSGGNAIIIFSNGDVTAKAQSGLK